MSDILRFENIFKIYNENEGEALTILDDINFTLSDGEISALIGPSGSGKSTMLHIAGLLEKPTKGSIFY